MFWGKEPYPVGQRNIPNPICKGFTIIVAEVCAFCMYALWRILPAALVVVGALRTLVTLQVLKLPSR